MDLDEAGNIKYPVQINNSIKLLNIGTINTGSNYHSDYNLFPVGYKIVRTHASMFHLGQKCEYICEINEGPDDRPIYTVTCEEDPNHPIVRDSSTGCWIYICLRVNEISETKKEKVTISGTERFGLLEPNIVKLLEELPNAEKCTRYNFKFKSIKEEEEQADEF